jgi:fructose-1,6-bisphosphatase/inositol monophosphatase family enzyme
MASMSNVTDYLQFASDLAHEAGEIMRRYFRSADNGSHIKADTTTVTLADTAINRLVIERIQAAFPGHGILGEEESSSPEAEWLWVVDPLDGTVMYGAGVPIFCFVLALVDRVGDGQPVVAVIYDPVGERLYAAAKGQGATLNGQPIHVSSVAELSPKMLADLSGLTYRPEKHILDPVRLVEKLAAYNTRLTVHQSTVFFAALVASGEYAASILNANTPWDGVAQALIVTEAGGKATDLFGNEQRYDQPIKGLLCANPALHAQIVAITAALAADKR